MFARFFTDRLHILKWPDYWHNQFLGLRGHQLVYTPEEAGERIKPETRSTTFGKLRSWQIDVKQWKQWLTLFWGAPKSLQMVTSAMKLRHLLLRRNVMTNLDSIFKSRDITLPTKIHLVKAMVFPACMDMRVGLWRRLSAKELMLLNCGVGEDSWESLGLQGDPTSPS